MAHAFIDAAADAGADAVKFQTHIASAESTLDEPFRGVSSTGSDAVALLESMESRVSNGNSSRRTSNSET
jgi:sialic acid synthase SpsE